MSSGKGLGTGLSMSCCLQATFKPQIHLREAAIEPEQAALLYVDVQNYNCHPEGAEFSGKPHVRFQDCYKASLTPHTRATMVSLTLFIMLMA